MDPDTPDSVQPRSNLALVVITMCGALLLALFVALGIWQIQRLFWKNALIERVEQRVHAAPVNAPARARWSQINAASDEYRRVRVNGILLNPLTTPVQASTVLGQGFWLITPLRQDDGSIVLINRGFIHAGVAHHPLVDLPGTSGPVTITGLLRISEPGGAFLRHNDPENQHWYSRDVAAIAAARQLNDVAPYFIDAEADPANGPQSGMDGHHPVPGLTVISFPNNHLVYSVTWFALAAMVGYAIFCLLSRRRETVDQG